MALWLLAKVFFGSSYLHPCGFTLNPYDDHLLGCGHDPLCIHCCDVLCHKLSYSKLSSKIAHTLSSGDFYILIPIQNFH